MFASGREKQWYESTLPGSWKPDVVNGEFVRGVVKVNIHVVAPVWIESVAKLILLFDPREIKNRAKDWLLFDE